MKDLDLKDLDLDDLDNLIGKPENKKTMEEIIAPYLVKWK